MVRFLVYINNKSKIDGRFLFCAMVRLTEPCPPLVIRVYLGFPFIDFMLLPFCAYIHIYINLNSLNNKISLFHDMVSEHQV